MNFGSIELPEFVTGRSILQERDVLPSVERIDRRCQACGLAGEPCQDDVTARMRHHVGERRARVARRAIPLEYRVIACWGEPVDPTRERRRRIEKRRRSAP